MKRINLLIVCITLLGCVKNQATLPTDPVIVEGARFSFELYDGLPQSIIEPIQSKLDKNYKKILSDLEVDSMKQVKVSIWEDKELFYENMRSTTGKIYYGATGWIPGIQDIRILYTGEYTAQTVLHEFCHAVSLALNPTIGNNPRWLWEAVAVYEAGEFRDPKFLSYLVAGNFPTISELSSDYNTGGNKIYAVGYVLSEFIISRWGKTKYVDLIKSNGNIQTTLGLSTSQFEAEFKNYVTTKYMK